MSDHKTQIQCSNCLAFNSLEASVCAECSTPIMRRYLWSSDKAIAAQQNQTKIDDRYLALTEQIFLDTQPNKPPFTPEEIPPEIVVYLKLFAYYPHIPQPYGLLSNGSTWLFDYGTVPTDKRGNLSYPQDLLPKISNLWLDAAPLQQLSWLWQIAKLWQPLAAHGVVSTLTEANSLRINGQILQLIHLQPDLEQQVTLKELGNLWLSWADNAHPSIKEVVHQLASNLKTGAINRANQLVALLDKAILLCSKSQQYSYEICALSDSGPSRSNNEDAAYPINANPQNIGVVKSNLAIVCDGVGGHDGGEIASQETIHYLKNKIAALELNQLNPPQISKNLATYIKGANDDISKRNDNEKRQERQRMGTTLVMTLAIDQQMYLGHVGDSRIYWITANSCHQVTVDDDLASREVRLGYALYRDSLQYPSAGALIQALGMRDSAALHPNIQRFIVDSECVFLLCSDGLSDFDRVEQQWRHKILPILSAKRNLASVAKDLIDFANHQNRHDNVTVALVHCKVKPKSGNQIKKVSWSALKPIMTDATQWSEDSQTNADLSDIPPTKSTQNAIAQPRSSNQIGASLGIAKQPTWVKPLILALLSLVIVVFATNLFIQRKLDSNPGETPPAVDNEEVERSPETETLD